MLCQLVCVDRRYQRMNCFNIREIQAILKRRFYTDLINTHDHHKFLDKTAMGLRFKTNNFSNFNSNIFTFYNYGIEFSPKIRSNFYNFTDEVNFANISSLRINSIFFFFINFFSKYNFFLFFNNIYIYLIKNLTYVNSLNLNFKTLFFNFFFLVNSSLTEITSISLIFLDSLLNSLKLFFKFFTEIFTNFNDFISKLFQFFFNFDFYFHVQFFLHNSFFYNYLNTSYQTYSNYSILLSQLNYNLINFFYQIKLNLNLFNILNEFFFYNKFFEIFYFYKANSFNLSYNYFNFFYFNDLFLNIYNNIILFFSKLFFNNSFLPYNYVNFSKNINEKNLFINELNSSQNINGLSKNNFIYNLNYDSYFVYFFIFFYLIYSLPFFVISFFKNIFNLSQIIELSYDYYLLITS